MEKWWKMWKNESSFQSSNLEIFPFFQAFFAKIAILIPIHSNTDCIDNTSNFWNCHNCHNCQSHLLDSWRNQQLGIPRSKNNTVRGRASRYRWRVYYNESAEPSIESAGQMSHSGAHRSALPTELDMTACMQHWRYSHDSSPPPVASPVQTHVWSSRPEPD